MLVALYSTAATVEILDVSGMKVLRPVPSDCGPQKNKSPKFAHNNNSSFLLSFTDACGDLLHESDRQRASHHSASKVKMTINPFFYLKNRFLTLFS